MEIVIKFSTPDNKIFDTEEEAQEHINILKMRECLVSLLDSYNHYKFELMQMNEIASFIIEKEEEIKDVWAGGDGTLKLLSNEK